MADTQRQKAKQRSNGEQPATDYVILVATPVYLVTAPQGSANEQRMAWVPVMNQTAEEGADGQPRVFSARGKQAAIRQYTGDGPDVIEGSFRAIPLSSWKGGLTTKRITAAERLPLEGL